VPSLPWHDTNLPLQSPSASHASHDGDGRQPRRPSVGYGKARMGAPAARGGVWWSHRDGGRRRRDLERRPRQQWLEQRRHDGQQQRRREYRAGVSPVPARPARRRLDVQPRGQHARVRVRRARGLRGLRLRRLGHLANGNWRLLTKHERPLPEGCGRPRSTSLCKPSLVAPPGRPEGGGDHSSRTAVARRLQQPTRRLGRAALPRAATLARDAADRLPMWPCSRWGLPCRPRYRGRGGLLPRRFTLTRRERRAVSSLWHSPRRFRHRALPGIVLCGARTFLPPCEHGRRSPERRRRRECAPWPRHTQRDRGTLAAR
jgi:hypothetical protein